MLGRGSGNAARRCRSPCVGVPSSFHYFLTALLRLPRASFVASCFRACPCIGHRHANSAHGRWRWLQSAGLVIATAPGPFLEPCLTALPLFSSPTVGYISTSLLSFWGLRDSLVVGALNPFAALRLALQHRLRSRPVYLWHC